MLKAWLRKWLGVPAPVAAPKPVAEAVKDAPPLNSWLSTTRSFRETDADLSAWAGLAQKIAIPFDQGKINIVRSSVGMDGAYKVEAIAMDDWDGGIKEAFNIYASYIPEVQLLWYSAQSFIGFQLCAVIAQHWFVAKACSMPAKDAVRNGWKVTTTSPVDKEVMKALRDRDKAFRLKQNCVDLVKWSRVFGIRIAIFEVTSTDPQYYEKPFNLDGVTPGSYKGIVQVDPYWITPELDFTAAARPDSRWFYEPTFWRVNGKRYHRSHLIIARHEEVADILKPSYLYGGISLVQKIYERVYAAERTANEAPQMALTKRSTVMNMDLSKIGMAFDKIKKAMEEWRFMLDNYGVKVVGKDDKIQQFDTALADFDELIMTQYQIACSITGAPMTKMMGVQAKGGIGNAGEYEEATYHEELEGLQEHDMDPMLTRHYDCLIRSEICPKYKVQPFKIGIEFEDLDAETSSEKAERQLKIAQRYKAIADTGAVDGVDIRQVLIEDEDSGFNTIPAIEPPGAAPRQVVQPNAPATAPNTTPGDIPTPAPVTSTATVAAPPGETAAPAGTAKPPGR